MDKSVAGARGFETTTNRYFFGSRKAHKRWLSVMGAAMYAESSGRKGTAVSKGFGARPLHPSRFGLKARLLLYFSTFRPLHVDYLEAQYKRGGLSKEELDSLVCTVGEWGDVPF